MKKTKYFFGIILLLILNIDTFGYEQNDIDTISKSVKTFQTIESSGKIVGKNQVVEFTSYYELTDNNIQKYFNKHSLLKNECLLKVINKNIYRITLNGCKISNQYTVKEIIDKNLNIGLFTINDPLVGLDENNNYFVYSLNKTYYPGEDFTLSSLISESEIKDTLILKEGDIYKLIKLDQFQKIEMFSKDFLEKEYPELNNKESLKVLALMFTNYKDYIKNDFQNVLKEIKSKSIELTNGKNYDEDKILAIYDWITNNITYDINTSKYIKGEISREELDKIINLRVQTSIGTFKDKIGVCEGIASLFHLMLQFAGVTGSEYEVGGAYSNKYMLHAWNKVGNYYFDATYDLNGQKNFYKLPKDLFYTSREINLSYKEIEDKILKDYSQKFKENLSQYVLNHPNDNYALLGLVKTPTFDEIKNILGKLLEINEYGQFIDENGEQNRFTTIQSYKFLTEKELIESSIPYLPSPKNWALGTKGGKYLLIDLLNSPTEKNLYKGGKLEESKVFDNLIKSTNSFSLSNKPIVLANVYNQLSITSNEIKVEETLEKDTGKQVVDIKSIDEKSIIKTDTKNTIENFDKNKYKKLLIISQLKLKEAKKEKYVNQINKIVLGTKYDKLKKVFTKLQKLNNKNDILNYLEAKIYLELNK
ncbi:MAG: transglutaminase-like domain-containing protein [Candidatus Gracilibacteria bacterium]|nr:transglutaminase-like domain-containing protein [Candidatus Gracilibacteria bacterium]